MLPGLYAPGVKQRTRVERVDVEPSEVWEDIRAVLLVWNDGVKESVKPHGRLVRLGFTCCHASTCRLSTYSSRTALQRTCVLGAFILEGASHLDAFSGYPVPT